MANDPIETFRQQAQAALSRGQYQEARLIYQEALGYRSDSPEIHYGLATVCFLLSDLHSAVYHFKEVIRLDPFRASAFINLGAVQNRLGQYDEALATLRRGIQLDANRAEGYYNLGLVYKQLGQGDLAIAAYREALRLNPRMGDAHFNLGNIYFEKAQFAVALAHYRQSLELRPKWDKAERAVENTQAIMGQKEDDTATATAPAPVEVDRNELDPNRHLDPNVHGALLRDLHQLIVSMDGKTQNVVEFLHKDAEIAIRDLSICVLGAHETRLNIDEQMEHFEEIVAQLQKLREDMRKRIVRAQLMTEKIART